MGSKYTYAGLESSVYKKTGDMLQAAQGGEFQFGLSPHLYFRVIVLKNSKNTLYIIQSLYVSWGESKHKRNKGS